MTQSLYPSGRGEIARAATRAVALVDNSAFDPFSGAYLSARVAPPAATLIAARRAHRNARGALKTAYDTTAAANIEADNALRMLESTAQNRYGKPLLALLRSCRGGKPLGALTGLSNAEQPDAVSAYLDQIDGLGDTVQRPREHIEEVRSTNEAMRVAVDAEEQAIKTRNAVSSAVASAERAFLHVYRPWLDLVVAELGEDGAAALLPTFDHSTRSAAASEDEDDDEDDLVEGEDDAAADGADEATG